jgi:hypothetical protein
VPLAARVAWRRRRSERGVRFNGHRSPEVHS